MRRFRFRVWYLRRFWFALATAPFVRFVTNHYTLEKFEGIRIIGAEGQKETSESFRAAMVDALQLIRSVDPRRFRRIQREIGHIDGDAMLSEAAYYRPWKSCSIDYRRLWNSEYPEWSCWRVACAFIHESTHGAIYSRQVGYTRPFRLRVERLCRLEERRFAAKADTVERQWAEALAPPLDEEKYDRWWGSSLWQRTAWLIARMREDRKTLRK